MQLSNEQEIAVDRLTSHLTYADYDPVGFGKTAVAIHAALEAETFPALVTMPAHLVAQWRLQLELWGVPSEEIASAPRGCKPLERHAALNSDAAFTLVSYNTWHNWDYVPALLDPKWRAFIYDESHRLRKGRRGKNGSTSAWETVQYLRTKTRSKHAKTPIWLMSGTPIISDAGDVWPLFNLANRYRYGSRDRFVKDTCYTFDGPYHLEVGAVRDPAAFHALLGQYSIRRRWQDIPELAKLKHRHVDFPIELDPATIARHRYIKEHYRDPVTNTPLTSSAGMIHALRRISISAKVEAATEFLQDHPGRCLLLAWYRETAAALAAGVGKKRPVVLIDGGTSEKNRELARRWYASDPDCVLVGTIGALKEGLNLQHGSNVLFAEQHYLAEDNRQAYGRVLRRGQTQPVLVYWMYAPRTFDMRVRRLARNNETNIRQALDDFLESEEWDDGMRRPVLS